MQADTLRKFKFFLAWQEEKEEKWLQEMSLQGWHLSALGAPGFYFFTGGEPKEYAYRFDFITDSKKKEDYYQLFLDAGWEHVGEMSGWQYFRKAVSANGELPEIYTDPQSKSDKYKRLFGFLLIFLPIMMFNVNSILRYTNSLGGDIIAFIYFTIFSLYVYALIRIGFHIRKINAK